MSRTATRFAGAFAALLLALPAWAIDTPARPAESPVALFMYATLAATLVVGFLYVYFRSRKERERERRKAERQGRSGA